MATPPSHEVLYFNGPGRAESLRIMLHAAGIEFRDERIEGSAWPAIKPTTPLGSLPVLTMGETKYCQSTALQRYAAKLAGFYPEDPLEALVDDEITDTLNELSSKLPSGGSEEERKARRTQFQKEIMVPYSDFVEAKIQANGGTGFLPSPCLADVTLMAAVKSIQIGALDYIDKNFFDAYPAIAATVEAAKKYPKVMAYYASLEK